MRGFLAPGKQCARQNLPQLIHLPRTILLVVPPHYNRVVGMRKTRDLAAAGANDASGVLGSFLSKKNKNPGSMVVGTGASGGFVKAFLKINPSWNIFVS